MPQIDRVLDQYDIDTLVSALARRRAREKRQQAQLMKRRRKIEAELRRLESAAAGNAPRRPAKPLKRKPNARRLNDITLAEALAKVMVQRKGPVHYKDLTDTVAKRGYYRTKSKNLLSTVAVTLKRDARFKKVEPGVYTLK